MRDKVMFNSKRWISFQKTRKNKRKNVFSTIPTKHFKMKRTIKNMGFMGFYGSASRI